MAVAVAEEDVDGLADDDESAEVLAADEATSLNERRPLPEAAAAA